jgi:hypothetical protein
MNFNGGEGMGAGKNKMEKDKKADTPSKVLKKQRSEGRGQRVGVDLTDENFELLRRYSYEHRATQTCIVNQALDLFFEKEKFKK